VSHALRFTSVLIPRNQDFIPKLKRYLLPRIRYLLAPLLYPKVRGEHCLLPGDLDINHWSAVELYNNRVYTNETMRVRYTTYDIRRGEDIVRLEAKLNIMVLDKDSLSPEDDPYRYGCVMGIFHADVMLIGELGDGTRNYQSHRIDFLWVRWYERAAPRTALRLQKLRFDETQGPDDFEFVDPSDVIRGVHLIPCSASGVDKDYSRPRFISKRTEPQNQTTTSKRKPTIRHWNAYYVNRYVPLMLRAGIALTEVRFVDRDMLMRYHLDLAIGHCEIRNLQAQTGVNLQSASTPIPKPAFSSISATNPGDEDSSSDSEAQEETFYDTDS
jgi:hypothetical protein